MKITVSRCTEYLNIYISEEKQQLKRSRLRPKIPVIELFFLVSIYIYIYILEGLVRRLYLNYYNNKTSSIFIKCDFYRSY